MRTIIQGLFLTMLLSATAHAALEGRLPTTVGGTDFQAYYDTVLDITWLADANAGGLPASWGVANAWAAGLDIDGVTGWRLPSMDVNMDDVIADCSTASAAACQDNELGYMFYYNLMGSLFDDLTGDQDPFTNIQSVQWSGTEYAPNPDRAWLFVFTNGGLDTARKGVGDVGAWAVRSGDVAVIPLPAGVWLLGSGLLGLAGLRRGGRRR